MRAWNPSVAMIKAQLSISHCASAANIIVEILGLNAIGDAEGIGELVEGMGLGTQEIAWKVEAGVRVT
ncbi:hypothetical protein ACFX13_028756 [Malus domestica]